MAPQRIVRASMAPPPSHQQAQPYYGSAGLTVPSTVGRAGHTYGSQALGMSGGRGDAGFLRTSQGQSGSNAAYIRPSERRSSQGRRQSNASHSSTLQAFTQPVRPGLKDPRNLRNDPAARARCQTEVAEFLINRRYPAEPKINQQAITQKDFESTFKFLYNLFDPSHGAWTGKFEDEVIKKCAPTSGYPFASEVNKSSLQTVGAKHSWHIILGLLHWLTTAVKVCPFSSPMQQTPKERLHRSARRLSSCTPKFVSTPVRLKLKTRLIALKPRSNSGLNISRARIRSFLPPRSTSSRLSRISAASRIALVRRTRIFYSR